MFYVIHSFYFLSGVAMTRDIEEELSETDEDEPSDENVVEERCEAEDTKETRTRVRYHVSQPVCGVDQLLDQG